MADVPDWLSSTLAADGAAGQGALPYWIAVFLGTVATFFLMSPIAIWFSSVFPVASDLSKTGSAGNAHPFPMVAGTLCTVAFAFPTILALFAAEFWFKSPLAALLLTGLWMLIAMAIGIPLVNVASRSIGARRENLAMVAQGR